MRLLNTLTDEAQQHYTLIGEEGEQIDFTLRYLPRTQCWMYDISYGDVTCDGAVLVASPNVIRNFRNLIPFGLMVTSEDALDPMYVNDFTTGRINVYLLNATDVAAIESEVYS